MSAFMQDDAHVRSLLQWALTRSRLKYRGNLAWLWSPDEPDASETHQAGSPWGLGAVAAAQRARHELTEATFESVGQVLVNENHRSVSFRYNEHGEAPAFQARGWYKRDMSPVDVLSALAGYEYQACEHPEWEKSQARAICEAIQGLAIRSLPGYDDGPWSITEPDEVVA